MFYFQEKKKAQKKIWTKIWKKEKRKKKVIDPSPRQDQQIIEVANPQILKKKKKNKQTNPKKEQITKSKKSLLN